jgi:hypothetical protein
MGRRSPGSLKGKFDGLNKNYSMATINGKRKHVKEDKLRKLQAGLADNMSFEDVLGPPKPKRAKKNKQHSEVES